MIKVFLEASLPEDKKSCPLHIQYNNNVQQENTGLHTPHSRSLHGTVKTS